MPKEVTEDTFSTLLCKAAELLNMHLINLNEFSLQVLSLKVLPTDLYI